MFLSINIIQTIDLGLSDGKCLINTHGDLQHIPDTPITNREDGLTFKMLHVLHIHSQSVMMWGQRMKLEVISLPFIWQVRCVEKTRWANIWHCPKSGVQSGDDAEICVLGLCGAEAPSHDALYILLYEPCSSET